MERALNPAEQLQASWQELERYCPEPGQEKLGRRMPFLARLSQFRLTRHLPFVWTTARASQWLLERDWEAYRAAQRSVSEALRSAQRNEGNQLVF